MHFFWNGAFGNRCFERGFITYASLSDFYTTLVKGTPEGLCSCIMVREGCFGMHGRVCDLLYTDGVLPYIPPRLDGPRWAIRKDKEWQEFESEKQFYFPSPHRRFTTINVTCNAFFVSCRAIRPQPHALAMRETWQRASHSQILFPILFPKSSKFDRRAALST